MTAVRALVENGRLASLLIALLLVAGLGAIHSLPRMEDPHITNRFASVVSHYPGASAQRVEVLVTEVLEQQLRRMEEVKVLQSTSRPGISVIQLELKDEVLEPDPVWSRARDFISDSQSLLPQAARNSSLNDQSGYANTAILALEWQADSQVPTEVLHRYAKELQSQLRQLPGTDFAALFGAPTEEILVELNTDAISQLQLSPADIAAILSRADSKISAGELNNATFRAIVEVSGELDSLNRIRAVPLKVSPHGQLIRLGDIADVRRQIKTPGYTKAIVNGRDAVMLGVRMLNTVRVDHWLAQVRNKVDAFQRTLPSEVRVNWLFEQESYTSTRLSELISSLLLGFVLILLVLMLTLGLRNALIVALSLPLTALFTLACMKFTGLPIHQMSVTGLVVALGIMVDNAIVIVDAIAQRRKEGLDAISAVRRTLQHLWLPLAGSTLTTMLAFAPIVLMPGSAGEFVGGIAISVIFALLGSYLISHTLIAGLAGRFSTAATDNHWYHSGITLPALSLAFRRSLSFALQRPVTAALGLGLFPLLGFIAAGQLTEQFFPPSDRDMFQIEVYLPPQSSLAHTTRLVRRLQQQLAATDGIVSNDWVIGGNAPSFYYNITQRQQGASHYAQGMVKTRDFVTANKLIPALQQQLDQDFPAAQILVRKLEQGPPFNAPVEIRLFGPDLTELKRLGEAVRGILHANADVRHTRATLTAGAPKLWYQINEDAGLISGLSLSDIAAQLQAATTGITGGSVIEQTENLPVRVRLDQALQRSEAGLSDLMLTTSSGELLPLSALASSQVSISQGAIPRRDGQRVNTIEAYLNTGVLPAAVLASVSSQLSALPLPDGYQLELGGESAKRNEAVGNLLSNLVLVITALLATLVLSFNSFRLTAIILLSALQSAGLGLLVVYLFGYPFGFTVIIGLLGLMGLAINAAIVILAELQQHPDPRHSSINEIMTAVSSCGRHIGSTTITTVGGFLPLIIAGGGFWPPFAIAIAGGTALTTFISLIWVPVMFKLWCTRPPEERNSARQTTAYQSSTASLSTK